jgi:hypothetical protein
MGCSSKASIGSRLAGPFREFGLAAGLLYAIDRVLGRVSPHLRLHVYEFMAQPVADGDLPGARLLRNLEVRPIRPGDPEIAAMPVRPEVMWSRIRQGCECLGVFQRGTFAGYMWFSGGRYGRTRWRAPTFSRRRTRPSSISTSTCSPSTGWVRHSSACGTARTACCASAP